MKNGNREISELAHESELRKTHLHFVVKSILIHQAFLACSLARVKLNLWLEMINILLINFRRFDWISAVSRKVLFVLESALRHFEVLKFLWQLSTTSQDQSSEKGPVHIQVGLKCTSNALQVHLKSPV